MKKLSIIFGLILIFSLLSGCSQSSKSADKLPGNIDTDQRRPGGPGMPDFGQPERAPDIRGVVKSITGNEAVILKVDLRGGRGGETSNSGTASSTRPMPAMSLTGGNIPTGAGGGPGFGDRNRNQTETERADRLARLKEMSTGEEKVLIPVGIQMLKPSVNTETKERQMVEATLSDVTADKTITIWLNNTVTDRKIAEFVLIN